MIVDPSTALVAADLEQGNFLSGCDAGRWRIVSYEFPILDFAISATEPDGAASEYGFRAELSNYAAQAPMVRIWDHERGEPLDGERRPKEGRGSRRRSSVGGTTQFTAPGIERPVRTATTRRPFRTLRGTPSGVLVFIFEDLHDILNSNARAQNLRASA